MVWRSAPINAPVFWQAVRDKIKNTNIETLCLFLVTNAKKKYGNNSMNEKKKPIKSPCIFHHACSWSLNNNWVPLCMGRLSFIYNTIWYYSDSSIVVWNCLVQLHHNFIHIIDQIIFWYALPFQLINNFIDKFLGS